jgi:hypothetical protein
MKLLAAAFVFVVGMITLPAQYGGPYGSSNTAFYGAGAGSTSPVPHVTNGLQQTVDLAPANMTGVLLVANGGAQATDPIVILATGQSNFCNPQTFAWSPPSNLHIWNWDGVTTHVGTAFAAHAGTKVDPPAKFAAEVAQAEPVRQVYVINISIGSQAISHWLGGTAAPDIFADIVANVVPALASIGASKIDMMLWWQGESDAPNPANYIASHATMMARFWAQSWFPRDTPLVVFGIAPDAIANISGYSAMSNYLQAVVNAEPDLRMFVNTASLDASYWDDGFTPTHMNAKGYAYAGEMAAREFLTAPNAGAYGRAPKP